MIDLLAEVERIEKNPEIQNTKHKIDCTERALEFVGSEIKLKE